MYGIFELAEKLTGLATVSGREDKGITELAEIVSPFFDEYRITPLNSFIGYKRCKDKNAKTILFDAHLDEIGFLVSEVCAGGFLRVVPCGKPDPRTLSASDVYVYGTERVKGVFTSKPPHLQEANESEKVLKVEDFYVDTGLTTEECKKIISIGDPVGLRASCAKLLGDRLVSKGFDDKICVITILKALELLADERKLNIVCEFTSCEESGYKGAFTTSAYVKPDYAVTLDVTHAFVKGAEEHRECIKMGEGGVVSFSATTSVPFSFFVTETAEKHGIPCQTVAEGNRTGSNANAVYIGSGGIPAILLSVPLKNMHTASEIVCEADVLYTAQLLAATVREIEEGNCNV